MRGGVATILFITGALIALVAIAGAAEATHVRGGTIYVNPMTHDNSVEVGGMWAERQDLVNYRIGDSFKGPELHFGDGQKMTPRFVVIEINNDANYFLAKMEHPDGGKIFHNYPAAVDDDGNKWVVELTLCCRLEETSNYDFDRHLNNPDSVVRLQAVVDLVNGHPSPRINIPYVYECPEEDLCEIPYTASLGQKDGWARHSKDGEAGDQPFQNAGPPWAPNEIEPELYKVSWDTRGAEVPAPQWTYYSVHLVVESEDTRGAVEFMVRIKGSGIAWTSCPMRSDDGLGGRYDTWAGEQLQFTGTAKVFRSVDWVEDIVMLTGPAGATFSHDHKANPSTFTFDWLPTVNDTGIHQIKMRAFNGDGTKWVDCVWEIMVRDIRVDAEFTSQSGGKTHEGWEFFLQSVSDFTEAGDHVVGFTWLLPDGTKISGEELEIILKAGKHEVCLLVDYQHKEVILQDTSCQTLEVTIDAHDSDGDGYADDRDNCPDVANRDQKDSDLDGQGDACEVQENAPAKSDAPGPSAEQEAQDECQANGFDSTNDRDADGILDHCDADMDNDGVVNEEDNCPLVPNPRQLDGNQNGKGSACEVEQFATQDDYQIGLANQNSSLEEVGRDAPGITTIAVLLVVGLVAQVRRNR